MDSTQRRVLSLIHGGIAEAYGVDPHRHDDHPDEEPCLDCGHALGAHHGPHGELRCGESGCGCERARYASRSHLGDDDSTAGNPDHNRRIDR